ARLFSCTMRSLLHLLLLAVVAHGKWFNMTLINLCSTGIQPLIWNNAGLAYSPYVHGNSQKEVGNMPDTIFIQLRDITGNPAASGRTLTSISQYDNPPRSSYYIDIGKGFDIGMHITPWDDLSLGTVSCTSANCKTDGSAWFATNAYQGKFYVAFACD
ncbi:hypothetical protein PENTCL1PPCAC_3896, partial [Pristionchus entomophagus]